MGSQGRDPAKRKVKPVEAQSLLDFDLGEGESSDDSDFRIEDHPEESDDYSINSDDEKKNKGSGSSDGSDSEEDVGFRTNNKMGEGVSVVELLERAKNHEFNFPGNLADVLICAGCLGSRSDDYNEIVECDGCGVTVHEGCYGVSDVASESSTISSASTEPWFCEACKAGVKDPNCELCPNKGGIFKETEVGAWVHLVCALYVPGVAFSEVERLSGVTLFEMAYSRWGARSCALCEDVTLARTGVCVGCDAGLCKTYFHVTCGQREGLLAEAHSEELEQADPFYAHCRLHSDKALINKRKRNWLALQLRTEKRKLEMENKLSDEAKKRIQRKLVKYKNKYLTQKENRNPPWVPTQKMARMLYSSASAMRRFQRKAECMGLDIHALEFQDAQMSSLKDVSRRWHVAPAFSVEFVGYYLERNSRVTSLRHALDRLTSENVALVATEQQLRPEYELASKTNAEALAELATKRAALIKLYDAIIALCPDKVRPDILDDTPLLPPVYQRSTPKVTPQQLQKRSISVPTAAALKMGVGFPLSDRAEARQGKVLSTSVEAQRSCPCPCAVCGVCAQRAALASCDTCQRHYHPHCLQPPLQRPPKKTKLYGWQCSECDKSSDSEPDVMAKKVPRRSRIRYSKDGAIIRDSTSPFSSPTAKKPTKTTKTQKNNKTPTPENQNNQSPIKVTIKQFEFNSENEQDCEPKKKDRKIKKTKLKTDDKKVHKRSFTSPNLTNTPLMSITPIVAESPNDSHNENSNTSTAPTINKEDATFVSPNTSFSSLLNESKDKKERDSKSIEDSIETTFANLSSDIATYKANRKRRKEKHRSRYSPDLLRTPKHKHKRKKKNQDIENPVLQEHQENSENHENQALPKITIKIKPFVKPDGTLDRQIFYVPSEPNASPSKSTKAVSQTLPSVPESPVVTTASPVVNPPITTTPQFSRPARGRNSGGVTGGVIPLTECDVCTQPGDHTNIVRCDECNKRYHFKCLEPPLSKNPKKRGYSWHCADCDPTDVEDR